MNNPFIEIDSRLSNIESLLIDIKHKSETEKKEVNLNVEEVAEQLKVSKQSVYSYIRKGKIKASIVGRAYLIRQADLDEAVKDVKSLKYQRES